jgi:RecA/RadA recombinase
MKFLNTLKKELKDTNTTILEDGESSAEFDSYIDTGCYALNIALSGSLFNGMPNNKVLTLAGESAVGKTYFVDGILSQFQKINPNSIVGKYDTESASTKEMMTKRGIDPKRTFISEPETIQQFKTNVVTVLKHYMNEEEKPPMILALDSLGNLSTEKELVDAETGKDVRDMTRSQLVRGTFRTIRLKLAKAKIPLLITNHTYDVIGAYIPTKEMSGGGGVKYISDFILFLSKKKDRDETTKEVKGNIITITVHKSRFTKENAKIECLLSYENGLDKYYGLLPIALKAGIFTKKAKGYDFNGKTVYEKDIIKNPEKYYTPENLEIIDKKAQELYLYGQSDIEDDIEELISEENEV